MVEVGKLYRDRETAAIGTCMQIEQGFGGAKALLCQLGGAAMWAWVPDSRLEPFSYDESRPGRMCDAEARA